MNITGPITSATGVVQVVKDGASTNTATLGAVSTNGGLLYARNGTLSLTGVTNLGAGPIIVAQNSGTGNHSVLNISNDLNALNLLISQNGARSGAVYQTAGSVNFSQASGTGNLAIGGATPTQNVGAYYKISGGTLLTNEIGVGGNVAGSVGVLEATGGVVTVGGAGTSPSPAAARSVRACSTASPARPSMRPESKISGAAPRALNPSSTSAARSTPPPAPRSA